MKFVCNNIASLVAQIYQRDINIDFKKILEEYTNQKLQEKEKSASRQKAKNWED